MSTDLVERYQHKLLLECRQSNGLDAHAATTEAAFLATPRHHFVQRYKQWGTPDWHDVTPANLADHLAVIYANGSLGVWSPGWSSDDTTIPSTISQPSLVLYMLDMLKLQTAQRVFELGAGSGWNAALIGHIVGPAGHVFSSEIIPEVAAIAKANLAAHGVGNVTVVASDGGHGYISGGPFDRVVFTAGTYDLPKQFYEQTRDGGLLLAVIKCQGGGDTLFLFVKTGGHFESLASLQCGFVPMTGHYATAGLEPICLEDWPVWPEIEARLVETKPFWWGGKGHDGFSWWTMGIRSYLAITEPHFRTFVTKITGSGAHARPDVFFGLWHTRTNALVLARETSLTSYVSTDAERQLIRALRTWVDRGMPSAASFSLKVYPSDVSLRAGPSEWITKRQDSQFVWALPT